MKLLTKFTLIIFFLLASLSANASMNCRSIISNGFDVLRGTELIRMIESPLETSLKKLEIGAAKKPLCDNCIQVDKYRTILEVWTPEIKERYIQYVVAHHRGDLFKRFQTAIAEAEAFADQDLIYWHQRLFKVTWDDINLPYAAVTTKDGIIADADNIPLANQEVGLIITKHFPWYENTNLFVRVDELDAEAIKLLNEIKSILSEYKRLLAKGGKVLILNTYSGETFGGLDNHIKLAKAMGFSIKTVGSNALSLEGIVLEKL